MNLHRVSTHISPIASEIPRHARGPSWLLETASSSRAPSCRIKLEAHSLAVSKVAHAGLVKALPKVKQEIGRVVRRTRPIKILIVDTLSRGVAASADAAVTPRGAARSGRATTAGAAAAAGAAATATATAAATTAAATTTTA